MDILLVIFLILVWLMGSFSLIGLGLVTKWFPQYRDSIWWRNYPLYGKPSKEKTEAYWRFMETRPYVNLSTGIALFDRRRFAALDFFIVWK
jgi:hypothetical protein